MSLPIIMMKPQSRSLTESSSGIGDHSVMRSQLVVPAERGDALGTATAVTKARSDGAEQALDMTSEKASSHDCGVPAWAGDAKDGSACRPSTIKTVLIADQSVWSQDLQRSKSPRGTTARQDKG